jgi:hypothetical protein
LLGLVVGRRKRYVAFYTLRLKAYMFAAIDRLIPEE